MHVVVNKEIYCPVSNSLVTSKGSGSCGRGGEKISQYSRALFGTNGGESRTVLRQSSRNIFEQPVASRKSTNENNMLKTKNSS
jgi:hypothetical protein